MGLFGDVLAFMVNPVGAGLGKLTGQNPLVGALSPSVALTAAGVGKVDEWSGAKANRERQKSLQDQDQKLFQDEMDRRNKAKEDFENEKKGKQTAEADAQKRAAESAAAAASLNPSTKTGRRSTILTGSLGLPAYEGGARRTLLGAQAA